MKIVREAFGQLEGDGADDRHGGAQQYDHLHGFGPDHGLDAAHERIGEAQNAHHADTEEDVDARHDVQRDRGQQQDDGHAADLENDERDTAHDADQGVEAQFEVFVGRGDVQSPEEGDEDCGDQRHDEDDARVEEQVAPVRGERLGRDGHEGDGREARAEDAQTHDEPRDAPAALEVVARRFLLFREIPADPCQREEIEYDHEDVEPSHAVQVVVDVSAQDHRGADAGCGFAAGDGDVASVAHHGGRHGQDEGRFFDIGFGHRARHGVVEPQGVVRDGFVVRLAAEEEDVVGAERRGRARHDGEVAFEGRPCPEPRVVAVGVAVDGPRCVAVVVAAAEEVETVIHSVALPRGDGVAARRAGPCGQFAPSGCGSRRVEREEALRGLCGRHRLAAACDVDLAAGEASRGVGQRSRERRPLRDAGRAVLHREQEHLVHAARGVAAADAEHPLRKRHRDAVGRRMWQGAGERLPPVGFVVEVDVAVPALFAAFPRHCAGEIGAASDHQPAAGLSGEDAGETAVGRRIVRGGEAQGVVPDDGVGARQLRRGFSAADGGCGSCKEQGKGYDNSFQHVFRVYFLGFRFLFR